MFVNGKEIKIEKTLSLKNFLEKEKYIIERVAVEKNGSLVPKKLFDTEMLTDDDTLEIVHFVGGG